MELALRTLILIAELALIGFVSWRAWRFFSAWRAAAPEPNGFERVVSLVLLALLYSALAALG
jgi:hypothetical protein